MSAINKKYQFFNFNCWKVNKEKNNCCHGRVTTFQNHFFKMKSMKNNYKKW